jgi:hypothetical protein
VWDTITVNRLEYVRLKDRAKRQAAALERIRQLAQADLDESTARHALHLYAAEVLELCDKALGE